MNDNNSFLDDIFYTPQDTGNGYYFGVPDGAKSESKEEQSKSKLRIPISAARPDMVVTKDIYARNNQLIIPKNTMLTPDIITKLMFYAIDFISVYNDKDEENVENKDTLFEEEYVNTLQTVKNEFEKAISGNKSLDEDRLLSNVDSFFSKDSSKAEIMNMLHNMQEFDDKVYMHSVNVALLCKLYAGWLGIKGRDEEVLVLCGLMHDIGKMLISKDILNKGKERNKMEEELFRQHTLRGYELLKGKDVDERVKRTAFMHHERYDGKGYPGSKKGEEIDTFSMIVSIADTYDLLASEHFYGEQKCPYDILFDFEERKEIFAPQFLIPIINNIAESYINHEVTLSNDKKANIIMLNADNLSKPVVRAGDEFIDLSKNRSIKIKSMK